MNDFSTHELFSCSLWSLQLNPQDSLIVKEHFLMTEGNILTVTIDQFVWGFSFHSWIFHSYGDVTIAGQGLQILTYTRHSWPLNTEGSLACHTYCDTGHPFIMVISEYPWHSYLLPGVWQWSCHYLFLRHRSVAAGIRTLNLPFAGLSFMEFYLNCIFLFFIFFLFFLGMVLFNETI